MTQLRTRREVLAASPAVALAALGGASAVALASADHSEAALAALGQKWTASLQRLRAFQDRVEATPLPDRASEARASDAEEALFADFYAVKDQILEIPARTLAGLQIKARVLAHDHVDTDRVELTVIERALAGSDVEAEAKPILSLAADILRLTR